MSAAENIVTPMVAALDLAANFGIPVFPCRSDNKRPLTANGFYDASTNLEQIESWRHGTPDALIGVPTGNAAKLLVIDIDPAGADWHRANAERLACERIHKTRRGHHLIYRMPDVEIRNSASKVAPGVDVRGEGGYVIWWPAHGLKSVGDLDHVAEPPAWLLAQLSAPHDGTVPKLNRQEGVRLPVTSDDMIPESRRNDTLFRQGCKLRASGFGHGVILTAIRQVNSTKCVPPLNEGEIQQIAGSVMRYEPEQATEAEPLPQRAPLDWTALAQSTPRPRDWIIDHWIPRNEVTLLAGPGGIGKTGVAQALASCVAIHREYLDWVPSGRKVLMWAGEDDPDELHRRQAAIAAQLDVGLADFAGRLFLESYHRTQIDLAAVVQHRLVSTPSLD